MKLKEKLQAIKLRKQGKSYKEILKQISVCKGTLSRWLRDVELTPKQKEKLYAKLRQQNAYKGAKANQRKRIEKTKRIIAESKKEAQILLKNKKYLFLAGLMLYWAEGDKSDLKEMVKFSNSDPNMIVFMMRWFRAICGVPDEKFRIALHIHQLHCRRNMKKYWSDLTKTPLNQFHKVYVKPTSLRHRRNPLYDGTCSIVICDKDLFRKIKGWRLGVMENISN